MVDVCVVGQQQVFYGNCLVFLNAKAVILTHRGIIHAIYYNVDLAATLGAKFIADGVIHRFHGAAALGQVIKLGAAFVKKFSIRPD